ncbi:MAG: DUF3459 domain-containing protein, partial [Gluconacetobacter liquefaciens]
PAPPPPPPPPPPPHGPDGRAFCPRRRRLRQARNPPRRRGAQGLGARVGGPGAVAARWRMADGAILSVGLNLGADPVDLPDWVAGPVLFQYPPAAGTEARLPRHAVTIHLAEPAHG